MKLLIAFTLLSIVSMAQAQHRAPAVEKERTVLDKGAVPTENAKRFYFKKGNPVDLTAPTTAPPIGVSLLLLLILASAPFLLHVVLKGDVVPLQATKENEISGTANTVSLDQFRSSKEESSTSDNSENDIKKAS